VRRAKAKEWEQLGKRQRARYLRLLVNRSVNDVMMSAGDSRLIPDRLRREWREDAESGRLAIAELRRAGRGKR
jgi:hypothetical protein